MRKRIILGSVLMMLVLLPVVAAPVARSSWSAGISLGSSAQGLVQYRINENLDITAGLGYDFYWNALKVDVEANYKVWKFNIQEESFDLTVGGGLMSGFYNDLVELSLYVPVGLYYSFADDVIPLDLYLHVGPIFRLVKGYQSDTIGFYAYLGAVYRF